MDKDNKYYKIIENLLRNHKKFSAIEEIKDDIIDDVYSHSKVILESIDNESVIETYLEKIITTSIITVPKKLGFSINKKSEDIPMPVFTQTTETNTETKTYEKSYDSIKVNTDYVDKMINTPAKEDVQEFAQEQVQEPSQDISADTVTDNDSQIDDYKTSFEENTEDIIKYSELSDVEDLNDISIEEVSEEITEDLSNVPFSTDDADLEIIAKNDTDDSNDVDYTYTNFEQEEGNNIESGEHTPSEELNNLFSVEEADSYEDTQENISEISNYETLDIDENDSEEYNEDNSLEINNLTDEESVEIIETVDSPYVETDSEEENLINEDIDALDINEQDEPEEITEYSEFQHDTSEEITEHLEIQQDGQEEQLLEETEEDIADTSEPDESFLQEENEFTDILSDSGIQAGEELEEFNDTFSDLEEVQGDINFNDDADNDEFTFLQENNAMVSENTADDLFVADSITDNNIYDDNSLLNKTLQKDTSDNSNSLYSPIDFNPEQLFDNNDKIDTKQILSDLNNLSDSNPQLKILDVYKLRYKDNLNVQEIAQQLNIDEDEVIKALNKMLEVV